MSQHEIIRRYSLEIEVIEKRQHPSMKQIEDYLHEHRFKVTKRTIERDFNTIRNEFGLEIVYNPLEKGYAIDHQKSVNVEVFLRFLEIVNTAHLLTDCLSESTRGLDYISFDTGGGLQGIENLKPLLNAIKNNRIVSFEHYSFSTEKTSQHTLKPYLLKEYQNRWYVIGLLSGMTEFRTFGIERIDKLEVTSQTFTPDTKLQPQKLFSQIIGLVYSENKAQTVVLSFTAAEGKYIKTLPWHSSQKVLIDDENEYRISLEVFPNYELMQLILKHGEKVKVIEPKELVDEIKENLQSTLKQYQ